MMLKESTVTDPSKAHGHDIISISMLKMSGDAVIEPLVTNFKNYLKCGIFPDDWKKEILYLYLEKVTNKTSKTIVQSLFFQSAARFLNVSCTITC